jgi:hypothetical protein
MLLVLTGCGSDAEGTPETYDDGLAFVECMREQGIDMPDPADEDALRDAMEPSWTSTTRQRSVRQCRSAAT